MTAFCHFLTVMAGEGDRAADADRVAGLLEAIAGLRHAVALEPSGARDRYYDDGPPPAPMLQLYYDRLEDLEAGAKGPLASLPEVLGPGVSLRHQAMVCRKFAVPEADHTTAGCAYMVHYWGHPHDATAWHRHYLAHHVPVMARFPALRSLEVYTPVEWVDDLDWPREAYFQRNRILFDDEAALERALHSPVREEMKADRAQFPAFDGGSGHFAMKITTLRQGAGHHAV